MDNDGYKDIYVCGIYHDLTNQDFVDFLQMNSCRRWCNRKKRRNKNDYKQNAKYGIPNYVQKQ
jgi:hypothetical protein